MNAKYTRLSCGEVKHFAEHVISNSSVFGLVHAIIRSLYLCCMMQKAAVVQQHKIHQLMQVEKMSRRVLSTV